MKNIQILSKKELKEIEGGFDPIGIAVGAFIAIAMWAYGYGRDAAERERRNNNEQVEK